MASEDERFDFADVVDAITRKMIRRHPHVFEDPSRKDEFMSTDLWDRIKVEEKAGRGVGQRGASILDDVPVGLPALTRAVKLQKRAAKVGFDWPDLTAVLAKAEEEIGELKEAITENRDGGSKERVAEELGDLLLVMTNLARRLGVDPEASLRGANARFVRRFGFIETALAAEGRGPEDATLEEMDKLWDEAKAAERKT
jgi:MazG family protein